MTPLRINLSALRSTRSNGDGSALEHLASSGDPISRRRLLGLGITGATALTAMLPMASTLGATLAGFEIRNDRRRVAFLLGGRERWVIDTRRFGGEPTLHVERSDARITVELRDAFYPGTRIPADLHCEVRPGLFGRTIHLSLALGDFRCTRSLERWLTGAEPARSIVSGGMIDRKVGDRMQLSIDDLAHATFTPDWRLELHGERIASLSLDNERLVSDTLGIALLDDDHPSIVDRPAAKRTSLRLERGSASWSLTPSIGEAGTWDLLAGQDSFDLLRLEVGESVRGTWVGGMIAESIGEHARLLALPHSSLPGNSGDAFGLPLRNARYAVAFDGHDDHRALLASYAEPSWLHTPDGSVLVGDDGDDAAAFELTGTKRAIDSVLCSPPMLGTYIPMGDTNVMIEPTAMTGQRLEFITPGAPQSSPDSSRVVLSPDDPVKKAASLQLRDPRIAIVRPEDLLVLEFEFIGMSFTDGGTTLSRSGGGQSYIIVHFPSQNIAEQAFFESDADYPVGSSDPDKGKGNEYPAPPPVGSRFSGPSRLVFKVPSNVGSIPYTLESLLNACGQFEMNVSPHSRPPKKDVLIGKLTNQWLPIATEKGKNMVRKATPKSATIQEIEVSGNQSASRSGVVISAARAKRKLVVQAQDNTGSSSGVGIMPDDAVVAPDPDLLQVLGPVRLPLKTETALETPFRLIIAPNRHGGWKHSNTPVTSQTTGRTELWHTRLGTRVQLPENGGWSVDEEPNFNRTVRAIWTRDPGFAPNDAQAVPDHSNDPFRMSLDSFDRHNIVHLTANYYLTYQNRKYEPDPVSVNRLMLSSLGAWMDTRGAWDELPQGLSVEEWRHLAAMGRDSYVRVVYAGFLFPFGHRASLIKITERKFFNDGSKTVAYLFQRMFIVVREPEKHFRNTGMMVDTQLPKEWVENNNSIPKSQRWIDLEMPVTRVRITTLITPNLDKPENTEILPGKKQSCFWPNVGGKDFRFHLIAEDLDGTVHELSAPLAFIGKELTDTEGDAGWKMMMKIAKHYETGTRGTCAMNGQMVTFADYEKSGDTTFETVDMTFGAEIPQLALFNTLPFDRPRFYPVVRRSGVIIPSIKHLANNTSAPQVEFNPTYMQFGFDRLKSNGDANPSAQNKGDVFFQMVDQAAGVGLSFTEQGDRSGGLVTPNMKIVGLSRITGPVSGSDVTKATQGSFDPEDFFKGFDAKIFGVIDLWELVQACGLDAGDLVPQFVSQSLNEVENFLTELERLQTDVQKYQAQIAAFPNNLSTHISAVFDEVEKAIKGQGSNIGGAINAIASDINSINLPASIPDVPDGVLKSLRSRIKSISDTVANVGSLVSAVEQFIQGLQMPEQMKIRFEWRPAISDWALPGSSDPLFIASDAGHTGALIIAVELVAKSESSGDPEFSITCSLENFAVDLIAPASFIKLHFEKMQLLASTGKKFDVNVVMRDLEFVGPLSFIETLKDLIPLDGFSDPPAIEVSLEGIKATFGIALPNISVGVLNLANMSLNAGFTLPFIGDPLSVNFSFCTREAPFTLTVYCFGGGGFFGITLDPGGIQLFEAAFEFGASISIDLGVASGGVEAMAGIYFKMTLKAGQEEALLNGYFRLGGHVNVLGLITVSIELKLELEYEFNSGKCTGRATLIIEIEVLIFSGSVEISCEKKFKGANGDPTFQQLYGPATVKDPLDPTQTVQVFPWEEYCRAFG